MDYPNRMTRNDISKWSCVVLYRILYDSWTTSRFTVLHYTTPFTVISVSDTKSCSPFKVVFTYISVSDTNIRTDTICSRNKIMSLTLISQMTDFETNFHRLGSEMEDKSPLSEVQKASEQRPGSKLMMTCTSMMSQT